MEYSIFEEWKPVVSYKGFYEVSSLGRVRSLDRKVNHYMGGKALKVGGQIALGKTPQGYNRVCLAKNGTVTTASVHRLVCRAFNGRPPSKDHHAAHINGVKTDNRFENLAWKTPKENEADKVLHGTVAKGKRNGKYTKPEKTPRGESHGRAKLTEKQVLAIRKTHAETGVGSHRISQMLGVTKTTIQYIINRKTWKATK